VAWVETQSMSFAARHSERDATATASLLGRLEAFRATLEQRFPRAPAELTVIVHSSPAQLAMAHPWLPLARLAAAPASRRYFAGWFTAREIHVLAPRLLAKRASSVPGSREALRLSSLHEYAHVVIGLNNPGLPPPFTPRSFRRYLRWTWLCEGAATHLSGQSRLLAPAVARRLRDGRAPSFPPATRDAQLLGGTLFDLLEDAGRADASVELASRLDPEGPERALERAFGRPLREVEFEWREYLADFAAARPPASPANGAGPER